MDNNCITNHIFERASVRRYLYIEKATFRRTNYYAMIRAFMIEFEYDGHIEFANVVEYKHSPRVFYITSVSKDYRATLKLILQQTPDGLTPTAESDEADPRYLNAVTEKIHNYIAHNPA